VATLARTYTQGELNAESIKLPRKNSLVLTGTYKTSAGVGIDVSSMSAAKFTAVSRITGLRVLQKTFGAGIALSGGGTGGIFTVTLSTTDTALDMGDYDYDLEITITAGTITLAVGLFRLFDLFSDVSAT
jgi:hypothetical protein